LREEGEVCGEDAHAGRVRVRKKGRGKGRRESALKEERSDELDGSKIDLEGREGRMI